MNILFYVYVNPKVRGGIERLIAELSSAATLQGHKVFILADCETGTDFPYPLHENVTIICKKSALEKKYSQFITQICADQHIDIAVIMRTGSWIHQIFAQALAYTQTRVILSEHAAPEIATKEFPNRSRLIALHSVDGVHLLLDDYKKSVAQELHDKVWVIPNFIETDLHYTTPYEDRHTKKIIGRF